MSLAQGSTETKMAEDLREMHVNFSLINNGALEDWHLTVERHSYKTWGRFSKAPETRRVIVRFEILER